MKEDYPGQAYFHKANPMVKVAEDNWKARQKDQCWRWYGNLGRHGYGKAVRWGKFISAHRLMMVLWYGIKKSDPRHVLHRCDNPSCVNPRHLFLGTAFDNHQDLVAKGLHYQTRKSFCRNGHPYNVENTYVYRRLDTGRYERGCRICRRLPANKSNERKEK